MNIFHSINNKIKEKVEYTTIFSCLVCMFSFSLDYSYKLLIFNF